MMDTKPEESKKKTGKGKAQDESENKERPITALLRSIEEKNGTAKIEERLKVKLINSDVEVDLPSSVICLTTLHGGQVFIVGTAHVSQNSVNDVVEVIQKVQPKVVLVELCRSRAGILTARDDPNQNQDFDLKQLKQIFQAQKGFSALLHVLFAFMFKKIVKQIKIMPGAEFRAAAIEGQKIGAQIVLADRPIEITLKRTWHSLSVWEKLQLFYYLLSESSLEIKEEDVERLKNSDVITELIKQMSDKFPSLIGPIIFERDEYLAYGLKRCPGDVVVAVVGLGHCKGIEENWDKEIDMQELVRVPQGTNWKKIIVWGVLTSLVLSLSIVMYKTWDIEW